MRVSITDHVSETARSSIKLSVIDAPEAWGGLYYMCELVLTDLFTDPSAMHGLEEFYDQISFLTATCSLKLRCHVKCSADETRDLTYLRQNAGICTILVSRWCRVLICLKKPGKYKQTDGKCVKI